MISEEYFNFHKLYNNHERFVAAPKFSKMVPFFLNDLCFTLELRLPSNWTRSTMEGLHYSLEHPSTLIPYPRFTKLIMGHYMIAYPKNSRKTCDKYHNLENNDIVKSIFNLGKNKAGVGMKIPNWMITDEMKLIENYQIYAKVFRVDFPTTQSQPIESIQGTHRTPNTLKTPNTPVTPNPKVSKGDHDDLEAHQNVEKVKEHLAAEEIEKMVEGTENVDVDEFVNSILDSQNDPRTRLDPGIYKENPEVEITDVVQPVNVIEEEDELAEDDYELRRSHVKKVTKTIVPVYVTEGLILERQKMQAEVAQMVADAIQRERENLRAKFTSQINNAITNKTPSQVDSFVRSYMSNHVLHVHLTQASQTSRKEQQYQLYLTMKDDLQMHRDDLPIWLALKIKFEGLISNNTLCISFVIRPRDQNDHHDDAHPEVENSAKSQKISKHGSYVIGESSSGQDEKSDPSPSTLEIVDEVKLLKVVDEMLRQRCTSGDEHQYHIDQMQNLLKNDINPHAKIFYIKRQKELGKPIEEVYSNSKIVQVIKTTGELGHEHKFVTKIIVRRANGRFLSITEPDYKNLNKNDIEDMYLLCFNGKVDDYAKTRLLCLSNNDAEHLQLFEEEIEEWLKHRD
ncbi:hypothetical protein Tco_1145561 [Tanacetum coccineum]